MAEEKEFDYTQRDFDRVRQLIYKKAGISLSVNKREMVYSRLSRRLRALSLPSFAVYLESLDAGLMEGEWEFFINALTTNLTSFFREPHHFPVLAQHVRQHPGPINIWCSAASTGEEPYSIAMTVCEAFGTMRPPVNIIATDIDTNVLQRAANGIYEMDKLKRLSPERLQKFFLKGTGAQSGYGRVRPQLRKLITFQQLNLLDSHWPVTGPFDVLFCRNVMIYFDKPTQGKILSRFAGMMKESALLFGGHSENFLYVSDAFHLCGKTVYKLAHADK